MALLNTKPNCTARLRQGFTLIEMLVIVVVLAIVGMLAIPSSSDRRTRLRVAGERLIADLEYAQLASIGRADDQCVVVFDLAGHRYYLARESDTAQPITNPATGGPYVYELGSATPNGLGGVGLNSVDAGGDGMVSFGVHGALNESGPVTIVLGSGSDLLTISIDSDTGEASVVD